MNQYLKQITLNLRSHGFTENTVEEIIRSISCLATHGILSVENAELQWSSNLDTSPPVNRVISADVLAPVNTNSYGLGEYHFLWKRGFAKKKAEKFVKLCLKC